MSQLRPHIKSNEKHHLTIGGVDAVELAEEFGTPLYVMDESRIRENYREFYNAFSSRYPKVEVKYACKANTSLAVLHILRQEGAGLDIFSPGELYTALKAKFSPKKIIFTGINRSDAELEYAVKAGVIINIDSISELERLKKICEKKKKSAKISFRVNPEISLKTHEHLATGLKESKFGLHEEQVLRAYRSARESKYLKISGIQMHIGSQITSTKPYEEAVNKLLDVVLKLKKSGIDLEFIDIGGGLGIRYREGQEFATPEELASAVVPIVKEKIQDKLTLYLEPGRYIVGDSAILLAKVTAVKQTPYKRFIGVDAGFNVLIRPVLYDAYHEVVLANKMNLQGGERWDIAGNICESGDILARDRVLPAEEGDIVAILDAGAYCMSTASQYNSRPRCAEVLVSNGSYELIRERETFEDLLAKQKVPRRLKK